MSIKELYKIFTKYPKISTDSRRVEKDSLFFALKGDNFNGNTYATTALENGASYSIVDEASAQLDDRYILVEDVLSTLQQLSTYHRRQLNIPIIAITGTNGKTTTKELVKEVLSAKFRVESTKGNLNNHIGVPLTLLSMNVDTQIGVVEMGANHPGEIATLCDIALPNFGLITNVGLAHLEGFQDTPVLAASHSCRKARRSCRGPRIFRKMRLLTRSQRSTDSTSHTMIAMPNTVQLEKRGRQSQQVTAKPASPMQPIAAPAASMPATTRPRLVPSNPARALCVFSCASTRLAPAGKSREKQGTSRRSPGHIPWQSGPRPHTPARRRESAAQTRAA